MNRRRSEPRPLGASLKRVLGRLGAPDPRVLERLEEGWVAALADAATHARPVRLSDGELLVEVDHPVWASRVRLARQRLEELAGEPLRVEVRVRP